MLIFKAIGCWKIMLLLHTMTPSLGGLLTPQTPPGADGKEDFCILPIRKPCFAGFKKTTLNNFG